MRGGYEVGDEITSSAKGEGPQSLARGGSGGVEEWEAVAKAKIMALLGLVSRVR